MSETATNGKSASNAAAATATVTSTVPSTNIKQTKEEPTLAQQEHDFFNQVPNEKEKAKMTKDSILALYGAAPSGGMPTNNQFMPGMPTMNVDNGSLFGMQMPAYQQQPAFGMATPNPPAVSGLNNFAQFGMMQGQPMNFQQPNSLNSMPNQSMGFANVPQVNPSFNQSNATKNNSFSTANHTPNVNNVNQQFGSLNLGNVWQ